MALPYSHSEQQQHLDARKQSGMSKKHYYRLHGLNTATFYYWLKHHKGDTTVTLPSAFIPARQAIPENNNASTPTLTLPNDCPVNCLPTQSQVVMQALSLC